LSEESPPANPKADPSPPLIWVLADQRQGTANQCLGVADAIVDAMGGNFETKTIRHSALAGLPNLFLGSGLAGLKRDLRDQIRPPWPDLVISGGRRGALIARYIKRQSRLAGVRPSFLAHIMHPGPGAGATGFDLIAVPRHDRAGKGENLFPVTGAAHRVNRDALAAAHSEWQARFDEFARPLVGLLLGGATRQKPFRDADAAELGARIGKLTAAAGGSLVITTSPRTGAAADHVAAAAAAAGAAPQLVHHWALQGDNPYLGILALADLLVVTGDSVSMCTEACAAAKPVYIYAPTGFVVAKHARFHADLFAKGYARPLGNSFEAWEPPILNPSEDIAAEIRRRMQANKR
jgi:mitochondrial fission protein ELM1